ncbi:hypothetical protein F2P56_026811 [Juglans regia]|uniref:CCHC-type domain-containing protein n=1 Tax=Juglans regia TaxID=51240 RepID=A0A833TNN9_JUGRE|nr:hypothetical protein F2P56_026811 [Juglans regia]
MASEKSDSLCIQFNGKNYSAWAFHFQLLVKGKELWGHVDGTIPAPNSAKELSTCESKDAKIISWILGSIEPHIILNLRPYKTSKAMWEYLKRIYTQNNSARRFQLEFEMANFSQGGLLVEDFYSGFSNLWAEYTDIVYSSIRADGLPHVQSVHETSRRDQFLMKLRSDFESVHSQLMNRDPVPSLDDCLGDLLQEEQRLLTRSTMKQQLASSAQVAFTAQGKSKGRDYSTTQCYSCKGFGHIATHCPKKFCNYCKKSRHIIKDCPIQPPQKQESAYSTFVKSWVHPLLQLLLLLLMLQHLPVLVLLLLLPIWYNK